MEYFQQSSLSIKEGEKAMRHKKGLALFVAMLLVGGAMVLSFCVNSAQGAGVPSRGTPTGGSTTSRVNVPANATEVPYWKFKDALEWKRVSNVTLYLGPDTIVVTYTDAETGDGYYALSPRTEAILDHLTTILERNEMEYDLVNGTTNIRIPNGSSGGFSFAQVFFPLLIVSVIGFFLIRKIRRSKQGPSSLGSGAGRGFSRSSGSSVKRIQPVRSGEVNPDRVTFKHVAGVDEAIEECREIRDFLMEPEKFRKMGAKIPKGVLLYGPPGCGKTLLARAVAGESGANFFLKAGSDFVEMYVGVGASRVRDFFNQARNNLPAILFIDEIDALGRKRGGGSMGGGGDEYAQTLNALLVEMDGFESSNGLIVMGATNRIDVLDSALLRPGRFDRHIVVDLPDLGGRKAILRVHVGTKPINEKDLDFVAQRTPGFSGADLANVLNEAAIFATRDAKERIERSHLDAAVERVTVGAERKSRKIGDAEKRIVAYHEAGHALVGYVMPGAAPVQKVTIIPRGQALGVTLFNREEDRFLHRKSELKAQLAVAFGGRAAELLIFADPTDGAGGDIRQATTMARYMVMQAGMSEKLGPIDYGEVQQGPTFGKAYSDRMAADIDREVKRFIEEGLHTAQAILLKHRDALERMVVVLLKKETVSTPEEIAEIFGDLPKWQDPKSSGGNPASTVPSPPASAPTGASPEVSPDSGDSEGDKNLLGQAADQVSDAISKGVGTVLGPLKRLVSDSGVEENIVETDEDKKPADPSDLEGGAEQKSD